MVAVAVAPSPQIYQEATAVLVAWAKAATGEAARAARACTAAAVVWAGWEEAGRRTSHRR